MPEPEVERLRCFIAIPLLQSLQQQISSLQQSLCQAVPELKPTKVENLHLTLHFLGEQTHDQLAKMASSMLSIGQMKKNFNAKVAELEFFPNLRRPRILWLRVQPESDLIDLYDRLSEELSLLGLKPDQRPYRPHLTIGRFKRPPRQTATMCPFLSHSCGNLKIDRMILFSSKLTAGGAVHTPLKIVPLMGSAH